MKKFFKLSLSGLMVTALILSTGLVVYSATYGQNKRELNQNTKQNQVAFSEQESVEDTASAQILSDENKVSINVTKEIKEVVKLSDKKNYKTNITNYTELLEQLNIHEKYAGEIERLLKEKHNLSDILTAYSFLNDRFGRLQEIEALILEKESGKDWTDIFVGYNKKNPEFVPRSFESGYIEEVMNTPGITADDIMLADRVSQKSGRTIQEVMEKRMVGETWRDINAWLDIVNGDEAIIRISVSPEQIDKYVNAGMDREVVVMGFVTAKKLNQNAELVIKELKKGIKVEELLDKYYTQKYY